ncbi:MAG: hypothetical protein LPK90_07990 [Alphaproteobacteria bacterium]|nr:hypothetical protein [Alphaproteobacteria bacterium]MDX5493520.1 hypothetical protein [Alphaproteobacteria bacterium]
MGVDRGTGGMVRGSGGRLDGAGLTALFLVAICGAYGAIIVSILPSLVGSWVSDVGLTEQAAGEVAAANVFGATLGLAAALFLVSSWPLPRIARLGLLLAMTGDALSIWAGGFAELSILRAVAGLGVGLFTGAIINWIGRHEQAARGFGMYTMLQFVLAAGYIAAVPAVSLYTGGASIYICLLALAALSFLLAPLLALNGGNVPLVQMPSDVKDAAARSGPLLKFLSVLAFGLFSIAAVGLWSYMLRYGEILGIEPGEVANILALSALCGIPGTILVVVLGARFGRTKPLLFALAVYTVPVIVFDLAEVTAAIFIGAMVVQSIAWAVVAPYFQAVQAALDRSGRLAVWGVIVVSVGAGLGPALAGFLIDGESYAIVFAGATATLGLAVLAGIAPSLAADREERSAGTSP